MQTFLKGKNGVPISKEKGLRITGSDQGLNITITLPEHGPIPPIEDETKQIGPINLKHAPYTPAAVLKAFMKIGLTLLPDEEVGNFEDLMNWVKSSNHNVQFPNNFPVIRYLQPWPVPNNLIKACILRRKPSVSNIPYMFLVLSYGNEIFQIHLPSKNHDLALHNQSISIPPFPPPSSPDPTRYGQCQVKRLDLTGREVVKNDIVSISLNYECGD